MRQDALLDQIQTLAEIAESLAFNEIAVWLRGTSYQSPLSRANWSIARTLAIKYGCYDADDWIARCSPK